MKKIMPLVVALVVSLCFVTSASAKVNETLLEYAKSSHKIAGKSVKLSDADVLRVEKYLKANEVGDGEAKKVIEQLDAIVDYLDKEGVADVTKLEQDQKDKVFNMAKDAAEVVGATLTYDNSDKVLTVYQNGVKFDAFSTDPYLKQTGSSNIIYVGAGIAALGLAAAVIIRKKRNA